MVNSQCGIEAIIGWARPPHLKYWGGTQAPLTPPVPTPMIHSLAFQHINNKHHIATRLKFVLYTYHIPHDTILRDCNTTVSFLLALCCRILCTHLLSDSRKGALLN